jgi:hypothetical protein
MPLFLALKTEALDLADCTSEALETIGDAQAIAERSAERWWSAELNRLRGVFLSTMGVDDAQIEASFCAAVKIAKEQKSISLEKRAEGIYAEYRRKSRSVRRTRVAATSRSTRSSQPSLKGPASEILRQPIREI